MRDRPNRSTTTAPLAPAASAADVRRAADEADIAAFRRGDKDAFGPLVRRHQQRAVAVAIGILHDPEDARDACQDAFMRAYRALDRFDGSAQFSTWLHRIVVNVCIDRLRRVTPLTQPIDDVEGVLASDEDPALDLGRARLGEQLSAALGQLGDKHRTALVLRELQGLSYQEIAQAMTCSVGTVMSRLFYARRRMQALLVAGAEPAVALAA
ncbi:MAG TPA: sigma-70 family RNA polymerase sigma factor [Polyangia bacterium]|jgi:RNA polymerase sigma-70 factor (ECF subfamily)|nr:sigma-70 family RNA polymerase sigma factor [Polyangia bacterium]